MNWKAIIVFCFAVMLATSTSAAFAQPSLDSKALSNKDRVSQAGSSPGQTAQDSRNQTEQVRTAQCEQVIEVANRATDAVQHLSQNPSNDSARDLLQTATIAEQATSEMQALRLTDSKLLQLRERFIAMYTGTSRATRDLATAANRKDKAAAEQAFTALQTATAAEDELVPAINTYCGRTAEPPRPN